MIRAFIVCVFGAALDLSISAAQIAAALLLIDWGWRAFQNKDRMSWRRSELDLPILIFVAWAFVTAVFHSSTGLRDALGSQSAFLLFFWAAQALDEESTQRLFRWLCVGAVIAGAWGILQAISKINYLPVERTYVVPEIFSHWPDWLTHKFALNNERAMGTRNHPLTYAESFIPGFFLLLGYFVHRLRERALSPKTLAAGVALVLMLGGILAAQGRAVWLGLGAGVLLFGWTMGRRFFFKTILLFVLGLAVISVVSPRIRGRFLSVGSASGGTLGDQQSKSTRYTLWLSALDGIRSHPFVGVGLEGTHLTSIDPVLNIERVWTETHNMYLQFALELGLIGFGIFIWILIIIVKMIFRASPEWRPAFAGMFAAFLIAGLTESWPKDKEIGMLFWTLIGNLAFLTRNNNV